MRQVRYVTSRDTFLVIAQLVLLIINRNYLTVIESETFYLLIVFFSGCKEQ